MTQTVIIRGASQRQFAADIVARAPEGTVLRFSQGKRTVSQNAKMHAMLSDIARAAPEGRKHSPDIWKALAMNACGHEVLFVEGLNGEPFPVGYKSSRLTKPQMSDLIEFLYEFGARHGVQWSEPDG